jgi:hypothetical protein
MQVLSVIVTKWKEIVDRLAEIITTSRGDGSRATLRSAATEGFGFCWRCRDPPSVRG